MFKDKVWKKVLKINEYELDEQIAEFTFELADQLDMDEEEINERFNILDSYEITETNILRQRMALYFIRYEINRLTGNVKKKKSLNK
ncbi:MAG: hypothetical protein PHX03_01780 [Bacilli bacterium]|nr:hypothetical protein [Bacilli bacterium]MDD4411071.1 hypothetical protein [Bacilli bacterium]